MAKSSKNSGSLMSLESITTYDAAITQAAAFRVTRKISDASLKIYGISTTQWCMIGAIHNAGADGISVTELSRILGTNLPYVTNSSNVLVERGIVLRETHATNARVKTLRINPEFSPMIAKIEKTLRAALRETLYTDVTEKELATYIKVLYTFSELLKS